MMSIQCKLKHFSGLSFLNQGFKSASEEAPESYRVKQVAQSIMSSSNMRDALNLWPYYNIYTHTHTHTLFSFLVAQLASLCSQNLLIKKLPSTPENCIMKCDFILFQLNIIQFHFRLLLGDLINTGVHSEQSCKIQHYLLL